MLEYISAFIVIRNISYDYGAFDFIYEFASKRLLWFCQKRVAKGIHQSYCQIWSFVGQQRFEEDRQEINFFSKFKDKLTKIKRKISLNDFRLLLILKLPLAFVLASLLRKRVGQSSTRSHISKQKILYLDWVQSLQRIE